MRTRYNPEAPPGPPRMAQALFRRYCRPDRQEELEGDLEEFYYKRLKDGSSLWKARFFYWWNVIRCYRPYAKSKTQNNMLLYPLFKSYFKLALRHSWQNKWSVLINVVGLGMALSMCVFLYMMYAYNFEFDTYYQNTDDIYRLHGFTIENNLERRNETSPVALDDVLRHKVSGIEEVASYYARDASVSKGNEFFTERVAFVSSEFFDLFETPLWYGSYATFGEQPVAYISRELAKKYYGDEIALDKVLSIYLGGSRKREVIIAGVFDKMPPNRSFFNEIVVHHQEYADAYELDMNDWGNHRYIAHFIRARAESLENIEREINTYIPLQNEGHQERSIIRFEFVPFLSPTIANHLLWRSYVGQRVRPSVYVIFTALIAMV
ncbi:MAG: permease prefix domain 2-containing transporter, partial [Bacteroidota bacterium]